MPRKKLNDELPPEVLAVLRISPDSYVADHERLLAEVRQADRQVKTGHYIRHEDMKAWLLSWGMDRELPLPKCACGRNHDDQTLCR